MSLSKSSTSAQPVENKLSSSFSQTQLAEFTDALCLFNPDANGQIKICELEVVLRSMGHTTFTKELENIFKSEITVNIHEFLNLIETHATPTICEGDISAAFQTLNVDGFVDIQKTIELLGDLVDAEHVEEIIGALKETPMTYEYFVKWMAHPHMRMQLQKQLYQELGVE